MTAIKTQTSPHFSWVTTRVGGAQEHTVAEDQVWLLYFKATANILFNKDNDYLNISLFSFIFIYNDFHIDFDGILLYYRETVIYSALV